MSYQNILIVHMSAIGDIIHALPVAAAIKEQYPTAKVTWVAERLGFDLLRDNPCIDEVILFDKPKFKSISGIRCHISEFSKLLRDKKFDLVLDLQGLFKSAAVAWLTGAKARLGYCDMRECSNLVSRPICGEHQKGHVIDRYLDVARYLGCQVEKVRFPIGIAPDDIRLAEQVAKEAGLYLDKPYIVLAPGTNWSSKCWPTSKFAGLASALWERKITPVLIGAPADRILSQQIKEICPDALDITGKTSLKQLAHLMQQSSAFVGGDTGPMHLAVAVGTPVVALFGPTDPARNGPYHGNNVVIQSDMPCIKCWKRRCDRNCMESINVAAVMDGIGQILGWRLGEN